MNLIINGENHTLDKVISFSELLNHLKIENKNIVIEANGEIINKTDIENRFIEDKMVIEIIKFVGGG